MQDEIRVANIRRSSNKTNRNSRRNAEIRGETLFKEIISLLNTIQRMRTFQIS